MNLHYLWLTEALELLTFFVIAPALGIIIAYRAWREREHRLNPKRDGMRCVAFGGTALLLFGFAKWIDADVRTPQYFLQLTCMVLSFLSLGASTGCIFSVLLGSWRWHNATRLSKAKDVASAVDPGA
jgi:hypothetical protein